MVNWRCDTPSNCLINGQWSMVKDLSFGQLSMPYVSFYDICLKIANPPLMFHSQVLIVISRVNHELIFKDIHRSITICSWLPELLTSWQIWLWFISKTCEPLAVRKYKTPQSTNCKRNLQNYTIQSNSI